MKSRAHNMLPSLLILFTLISFFSGLINDKEKFFHPSKLPKKHEKLQTKNLFREIMKAPKENDYCMKCMKTCGDLKHLEKKKTFKTVKKISDLHLKNHPNLKYENQKEDLEGNKKHVSKHKSEFKSSYKIKSEKASTYLMTKKGRKILMNKRKNGFKKTVFKKNHNKGTEEKIVHENSDHHGFSTLHHNHKLVSKYLRAKRTDGVNKFNSFVGGMRDENQSKKDATRKIKKIMKNKKKRSTTENPSPKKKLNLSSKKKEKEEESTPEIENNDKSSQLDNNSKKNLIESENKDHSHKKTKIISLPNKSENNNKTENDSKPKTSNKIIIKPVKEGLVKPHHFNIEKKSLISLVDHKLNLPKIKESENSSHTSHSNK